MASWNAGAPGSMNFNSFETDPGAAMEPSATPPTRQRSSSLQQHPGSLHLPAPPSQPYPAGIPGPPFAPLPHIVRSYEDASATAAEQASPLASNHSHYGSLSSPPGALEVPGQQSSQSQPAPRQPTSYHGVTLNVSRKGGRGHDVRVEFDFQSKESYISSQEAGEIGLMVLINVFSPTLQTSRSSFAPEYYATYVNIWSDSLGLKDKNKNFHIAIAPYDGIPLTLGLRTIASFMDQSEQFEALITGILQQQGLRLRRNPRSNQSSLAPPPSWLANPLMVQPNALLTSSSSPSNSLSHLRPPGIGTSSAGMSSYSRPTPLTSGSVYPPSASSFPQSYPSAASGSNSQSLQYCPPNLLQSADHLEVEATDEEEARRRSTQHISGAFSADNQLPMNSGPYHGQQSTFFPQNNYVYDPRRQS